MFRSAIPTLRPLKLSKKGGQVAEYGVLASFVGVVSIAALSPIFTATKSIFAVATERLASSHSLLVNTSSPHSPPSPSVPGPNPGENEPPPENSPPDSGGGGGPEQPPNSDTPPPDEQPETPPVSGDDPIGSSCRSWVSLRDASEGDSVVQITVPASFVGTYKAYTVNQGKTRLDLVDAVQLDTIAQSQLLLIEWNGTDLNFESGFNVSVYSFDGTRRLIDRAKIEGGQSAYTQGDEHLVGHNKKLLIDTNGTPPQETSLTYDRTSVAGDPSRGNNDGMLDFSDLGCVSYPPWHS